MEKKAKQPNLFGILKPYKKLIILLLVFALSSNAINLLIPKLIASSIDDYLADSFDMVEVVVKFSIFVTGIFVFACLQALVQTFASEKVARDLRATLIRKISRQSMVFVQKSNPDKLLTNLTSDIDAIKNFVSMAIVSIVSSLFIIVGVSILLLITNWKLALIVLLIIPLIATTFYIVLKKVRVLFMKSREVIDWLNRVINESILGSSLIRILNSQQLEYNKFLSANTAARDIGLGILRLFATMIPIITFVSNLAILAILVFGGNFVIGGSMSLGDYAAFSSYISLLIFPIMIIGFMSNVLAQAGVSYQRISEVLVAPVPKDLGALELIDFSLKVSNLSLSYENNPVLKSVSFEIKPQTKTAIVGPTAAGKTQLINLLVGLNQPDSGEISIGDKPISAYDSIDFYKKVAVVFQDSVLFRISLKENIAFNSSISEEDMRKAIVTAELNEMIKDLPDGLETLVKERGANFSGGQKQRIMLARALALNPKILFLDDFTARVDQNTERKIIENLGCNYPDLTLVSVTQKISSVKDFDKIILLMEGELIAEGTHDQLLESSPEYIQIYNSQKSTNHYD